MSAPTTARREVCSTCRFWSEMVARANSAAGVEALCLTIGSRGGRYTLGSDSCEAWRSAKHGAVDDPDTGHRYRLDEARGQ